MIKRVKGFFPVICLLIVEGIFFISLQCVWLVREQDD